MIIKKYTFKFKSTTIKKLIMLINLWRFVMRQLFLIIFMLSLSLQANAECISSELFSGKASVDMPKKKGMFSSTPKPTLELIEEVKSLAKLNALDDYVSKCLKNDRTKMDRYLLVADKLKSKIDLIVNIEREKQTENKKTKTLNVHVRASINSAAFDSMIVGQSNSNEPRKKLRMISFFIARKADSTDTQNFDDKKTSISKSSAGVTAEKSATTDGTTTAMNKEGSAYVKTQNGGSTVKKQRSSKRNWIVVSSKDLNAAVQKVMTNNKFKGGKYASFAKKCGAPSMKTINEEFSQNDTISEDTEADLFDAIMESDSKRCKRIRYVTIGTVSYNTALKSKVTGKPTVSGSVRVTITEVPEDDFPQVIASIGPINIRASGLEDNDAEKNALIMAGTLAGQEIVDSLKSLGY